MAVLDTTFLIAIERGDETAQRLYEDLVERGEPLRVPAAVWVEYLSPMKPAERRRAREMLEGATLIEPFERATADEAIEIQFELLGEGRRLGWHDLQVAATARSHREAIVSNDAALASVPGVETQRHE